MKRFTVTILIFTAAFAVACVQDHIPALEPTEALFNKKGGGGGGSTAIDPTAAFYLPASQGSLGMWGDEKYTDSNPFTNTSRYRENECGVHAKIFATTELSNSGDAIMDPANPRYRDRKCKDYPRKVRLDFSSPVGGNLATGREEVEVSINTLGLQNTTTSIPQGTSEPRDLILGLTGSRYCDGLRFRERLPAYGDIETGADRVIVTRVDTRTWRVQTAEGHAKAACLKNGDVIGLYDIPVDFYIVASRDL